MIPSDLQVRKHYNEKVSPFIGKQLIKVFTGQRRVGKSYLLFQVAQLILEQDPNANLIFINLEDLKFSNLKNAQLLNKHIEKQSVDISKNYIFIDEIQEVADFETLLRSLILNSNNDVYCTGSNANLLSGELASFLSGRYIEINVYSLSYLEFLKFHSLEKNNESLELYMKFGGLPYLKHLPLIDEVAFEYLKNIYTSIIYRDIIQRYQLRNSSFLERLIQFLASNTGSLFSANRISDFLKSQQVKMAPNQVINYLEYLTNAYVIKEVQRYDIIGKKLFEVNEKFYFENLGIRHGIWGYRQEDMGKILENLVYNHLVFLGFDCKVGVLQDQEIDFVAELNNEKVYIQVALTVQHKNTFERELGNLLKIDDNYAKYLITKDGFKGNSYKGIYTKSILEFLCIEQPSELI